MVKDGFWCTVSRSWEGKLPLLLGCFGRDGGTYAVHEHGKEREWDRVVEERERERERERVINGTLCVVISFHVHLQTVSYSSPIQTHAWPQSQIRCGLGSKYKNRSLLTGDTSMDISL